MKKLIISLCLILLCTAVFNSRVYAAFIYDIDFFEQYNGTSTFTDTFSDGFEPPDGPYGASTYWVGGNISNTRESGGLLELNSEDAVPDDGEMDIFVGLFDGSILSTSGSGGYVMGKFEVNDGFASNSYFGIEMFNWRALLTKYSFGIINFIFI